VRFFELDRAFVPSSAGDKDTPPGVWHAGVVAGGPVRRSDWRSAGQAIDFFHLKGDLEDLAAALGIGALTFRAADRAPFVAGAAADIVLADGRTIGVLGEIDAQALVIDRLTFKLYAFELDLELLVDAFAAKPAYTPLPRQPAVTRDLAFVVPLSVAYDDLAGALRTNAGPHLEATQLVDRYQDAPMKSAGRHSLAFRLVFRDPQRTLTSEDVNGPIDAVVAALGKKFGAELRA
jgi:phenylalanyl-tRNA synthetase beta chain